MTSIESVTGTESLGAESLLGAVLDDLTALVSRLDANLNVLFANRAYIAEFAPDSSLATLQGQNILQYLVNEDDRTALASALAQLTPQQPVHKSQIREKRRDGTIRTYMWTNRALYDATEQLIGYQAVGQDITEEAESRDALKAILSGAPDGIIEYDNNWRLVVCNQAAAQLFGWQTPPVIPETGLFEPDDLAAEQVSEFTRLLRRRFPDLLNARIELTGQKVDGTSFPLEVGFVTAGSSDAIRYVAFLRDLTEQHQLFDEVDRQRRAVAQTEKMSALGSLLSNVAHELNNPLSVVVTQAELLADKSVDEPTIKRAGKIKRAATRCADIVRTFLAIARQGPGSKELFTPESTVQDAVELVEHALRTSGISLDLQIDENLPFVYGDPVQIGQVLSNLLVNSQQALMEQAGVRNIQLCVTQSDDMIQFSIADNGPGIFTELRERIFEPFFTTKPMGDGTGIGLAIARSIAIAHDGTLSVDDSALGGAAFTLTLPVAQSSEQTQSIANENSFEAQAAGKRILIVDDEEDVAESIAELLSDAGYKIQITNGGRTALNAIEADQFDAIISDIRMPDMDGATLYTEVCQRWPALASRFGVITGDSLNPMAHRFLQAHTLPRMEKPFTRDDVLRLAEALLSGS